MRKISFILLFAGASLFAYGSTPGKKEAPKNTKGEQIYNQVCFKCHQLTGMGLPGVFPPLKGSDFLKTAPKRRLLEQVLKGSNEGLTVNGMQYSTPMPAQVTNVDDAVAVVNYVLNAWGNNYGHATKEDAKGLGK